MLMWPMLVFGYENFMGLCLLPEFDRIMDEFAEIKAMVESMLEIRTSALS